MATTYDIDTTPHAGTFIRALQNLPWSTTDAISEFIDNSFGAGRGDAKLAWVQWHQSRRILQVFDNGRGMEDISALFRVERMDNFTPGDIGKFGFGGTFALLWLSQKAKVWSLRDGLLSWVEVDWHKQASGNSYDLKGHYAVATEKNCPAALFDEGHGTLIELKVAPKRQIRPSNAKRDLALNYGPALRHGRTLYWRDVKSGQLSRLADRAEVPKPKPISIEFKLDEHSLKATGEVGVAPDASVAESGISICFGPRLLIPNEKQCFHSPDGTKVYGGAGVRGYVDLSHSWMEGEFLSTTKAKIDDSRARKALMEALFETLEPLLKEVEEEHRQIRIKLAVDELNLMFNRALSPRMVEDDDGLPQGAEKESDGNGDSPPSPPDPDAKYPLDPNGKKKGQAQDQEPTASLDIRPQSDAGLKGLVCLIEEQGDKFVGWINEDYNGLLDQLEGKKERSELYAFVATELARAMLSNGWKERAPLIFKPRLVRAVDELPDAYQQGKVTRFLLDRIEQGK